MLSHKTKNIISASALVMLCTFNVAYAEDIAIDNTSFSYRITKQFKEIFNIKDTEKVVEKQEEKIEKSIIKNTEVKKSLKEFTDDKDSTFTDKIEKEGKEKDVNKKEFITTTEKITLCDEQFKMISKREKINKQIKNQISDKNKLVESLIIISSSTSDKELKENFDSKILSLEESVSLLIKDQKTLSDLLASTTEMLCLKIKKDVDKNNIKIKKLETEISKKSQNVNSLIKVEIKALLENTNE